MQEEHTAPLASVWCWYKVGSKDERPGLTGVSHWVEHMNFKGTTNIPRDQVKGIIEQFGGSWNGYTWIDQTTYLETATRDALDRMLFIESERMARCLYHPDDCESERTVIISELQGGENDPDQLLDQEVTATAFKAHPYRHPTIGWLSDLQTMTRDDLYGYYRRYYIPNNATLVIVGDVDTDEALRKVERHFGPIPAGPEPARLRTVEPEQTGERRVTLRKEGHDGLSEGRVPRAWRRDAGVLPALLVLDAVLTGAKGVNLWSQLPRAAAAAQRPAVPRAGRRGPGLVGLGVACCRPQSRSSTRCRRRRPRARRSTAVEARAARRARPRAARRRHRRPSSTRAKAQLHARLVFDNDSVTNIAHQLGYFETIGGAEQFAGLEPRLAAVTPDAVCERGRDDAWPASNRTIGWFDPLPIAASASAGRPP